MSGEDALRRRHHTVSKFYLRGFADDNERLTRIELPGSKAHLIGIGDATVRRDFYMADLEDGTRTDIVERQMGDLEATAADGFRKVVDERLWPITGEARAGIAAWVALHHLRSPAVRASTGEIKDFMLKMQIGAGGKPGIKRDLERMHGRPIPDDEVDEFWDRWSNFDSWTVAPSAADHLQIIAELLPGTVAQFMDRGWTLFRFERKALLTCDTPVRLLAGFHDDQFEPVGLATAGVIVVPLSRRVGLYMTLIGVDDMKGHASAQRAREINRVIAYNARQAIFHHPDDDPLAGMPPLHEPIEQEMDMGDALERFTYPDGMRPA